MPQTPQSSHKRKREKFPKRKGEGGKKRNFLRFISTVILPMIKNTENQQKNRLHITFHLHNILDSKNQELCRFISIMSLQKHFTGVRRVSAVFPFTFLWITWSTGIFAQILSDPSYPNYSSGCESTWEIIRIGAFWSYRPGQQDCIYHTSHILA